MQYPGDIQKLQRISLLILLFCIAGMAAGADAATAVRGAVTTTSPFSNPNALTTATTAPVCQAPCECLSTADAQARWGAGGYTQCSQTPCNRYSSELGTISYYCYQQKKVTTAVIGNIPPVTTTLVPVIKNVPTITTTTPAQYIVPDVAKEDKDHDGLTTFLDNCPYKYNPNQADSDGDGVGDACDICWYEDNNDQIDSDNDCAQFLNNDDFWGFDPQFNKENNPLYATCGQSLCGDPDEAKRWLRDPKCGDACDNCPDMDNSKDSDNDGISDCDDKIKIPSNLCNGELVDLKTDANNCGGCGKQCNVNNICKDGSCTCKDGWDVCKASEGCHNLLNDAQNCGQCKHICLSGQVCCSGKCSSLQTDEANCGACGNSCSDPASTCCNSKCTNLKTSTANCGACGNKCPDSAPACCNGACTNLTTDTSNCGMCGMACNSGDACTPYAGTGICQGDMDHDGVPDIFDNCLTRYNPEQWAMPGSTWGDACRCLIYPDALGGGDLDRDCRQDNFIPLRLNGGSEKVDIVFIPDCIYLSKDKPTREQIHDDAVRLIVNGWDNTSLRIENHTFTELKDLKNKVNFYLSYSCVAVSSEPQDFIPQGYSDFTKYYTFADTVAVIVGPDGFRAWGGEKLGINALTVNRNSSSTFMHELGHSFFKLGDEYCCDSVYGSKPNTYRFLSDCQYAAANLGLPASRCDLYCNPATPTTGKNNCYGSTSFCGSWGTGPCVSGYGGNSGETSPGLYKVDTPDCLMDDGAYPWRYETACARSASTRLSMVL